MAAWGHQGQAAALQGITFAPRSFAMEIPGPEPSACKAKCSPTEPELLPIPSPHSNLQELHDWAAARRKRSSWNTRGCQLFSSEPETGEGRGNMLNNHNNLSLQDWTLPQGCWTISLFSSHPKNLFLKDITPFPSPQAKRVTITDLHQKPLFCTTASNCGLVHSTPPQKKTFHQS